MSGERTTLPILLASSQYDAVNEQQVRSAVEDRLRSAEFNIGALETDVGRPSGPFPQSLQDKCRQRVAVLDYIDPDLRQGVIDGTNTIDLAPYIARAWSDVTARSQKPALVFTSGVYRASAFPNFAVENAVVLAEGTVRLRYTGTQEAVFLDGGTGSGVSNIIFGGTNHFLIECPRTGKDALKIKNVHRSTIKVNARGAGWSAGVPAFYGIRVHGCVCTIFETPIVSENVDGAGWYNDGSGQATPLIGVQLDQIGAGQATAYCLILNPVMEGVAYGIYLSSAIGNVLVGGTAEACTNTGIYFDTPSANNRAIGVDTEANASQAMILAGTRNAIIDCDTDNIVIVTGNAYVPTIRGGAHQSITIIAGVNNAQIGPLGFNRLATSGAITDGGTNTQIRDCINLGTATYTGKTPIYDASGNIVPQTNDGGALGSTSLKFSDVFLASGAVVNFNSGDIAITHSTDDLNFSGGTFTFPNTGLHVFDTNSSHDLILKPGSDITADRTLTITTGDADATINLGVWSISTTAPTPSAGSFTTASASIHYLIEGKKFSFIGSITITTVGTGTGNLLLVLPATSLVAGVICAANASSGAVAFGFTTASSATLTVIPTAALASGHVYYVSGTFEIA